ncbi:hypothetical protein BH10PSE17_BH10PSE17_25140 [soil metagenome]
MPDEPLPRRHSLAELRDAAAQIAVKYTTPRVVSSGELLAEQSESDRLAKAHDLGDAMNALMKLNRLDATTVARLEAASVQLHPIVVAAICRALTEHDRFINLAA